MVNAISFINAGVSRANSSDKSTVRSAEALDRKIKQYSEKLMKFIGTNGSFEIIPAFVFAIDRNLPMKDIYKWFEQHNIKIQTDKIHISDVYLTLIALTFASLPNKAYEGVGIYVYSSKDDSDAEYCGESDSMGINAKCQRRYNLFNDNDQSDSPALVVNFESVKDFSNLVLHELAHRWQRFYDCREFYDISWRRLHVSNEMIGGQYWPYTNGQEWDFAVQYKDQRHNRSEDLSTVIGEMYTDTRSLIMRAVENLYGRSDRDLADKVFYCYRLYGNANDPDNWIVRSKPNGYIYRSGGETWALEIGQEGPTKRRISDRIDPNAFINASISISPMEPRPTK